MKPRSFTNTPFQAPDIMSDNNSENTGFSIEMISHTQRNFREVITRGNAQYIKTGDIDDLPDYLIELRESSSIHGALCTSISDLIFGAGWAYGNGDPVESGPVFDWLNTVTADQDGETTSSSICDDLYSYGYSVIEILKSESGFIPFRSEIENWRFGKMNDDREIEFMFYSRNFLKPQGPNTPKPVPVWKPGSSEDRSVLVIRLKPKSGKYYPRPDHFGARSYIELDKEIGTFHLNNILNGLAPSMFINFNNGVPETEEKRKAIRKRFQKDLQGTSNAGKFMVGFSNGKDKSPDITVFPVSDLDKQFDSLARTVVHQILVGHRVISPMSHGVRDFSNGFSSNADELKIAAMLFERNVISKYRRIIQKSLWPVFEAMGETEKLYLNSVPLQELTDKDQNTAPDDSPEPVIDEPEALSKIQLGANEFERQSMTKLALVGKKVPETWQLIETQIIDDDGEFDLSAQTNLKSHFVELFGAEKITSDPTAESNQDRGPYLVRYAFMPLRKQENSRDFCQFMEGLTEIGTVFRREDVIQMSFKGVNKDFGHEGRNYNLFKYKGGPNCHHFWMRMIFLDTVKGGSRISVNEARRRGFVPTVNDPEVSKLPIDMVYPMDGKPGQGEPSRGHHPDWKGRAKEYALGFDPNQPRANDGKNQGTEVFSAPLENEVDKIKERFETRVKEIKEKER